MTATTPIKWPCHISAFAAPLALSILLAAVTVTLWVRSCESPQWISLGLQAKRHVLYSANGSVALW